MANRHPERRHGRVGGGRVKIDWAPARHWFIRDPTVSLGEVARRFGVSEAAVRKHAHARCRCCPTPWEDLRAEAMAKAEKRLQEGTIRSFEERQADTIRVAQKLRTRVLDAPTADVDLTAAVRTIPRYATLEQLYAGEPTAITMGEVEVLLGAVLRATRAVLEEALAHNRVNGKRVAVLAYFDETLPVRVAELTRGHEGE